jgi:hypothetical protein
MSWHVDIPLWPSHQAPLRSFYAVSIPDNRYGITSFADRAWGYRNMTAEEQQEAEHWKLLYQSWYEPGTHLTYLPAVAVSPYNGEKYLQFTLVTAAKNTVIIGTAGLYMVGYLAPNVMKFRVLLTT